MELLDEQCHSIEGLSGADAAEIREPGLRQPATWNDSTSVDLAGKTVRVKVTWKGRRPDCAHLFAVYVNEG